MALTDLKEQNDQLVGALSERNEQLEVLMARLRDANQRVSLCQSWEDAIAPLRRLMTNDVLNTSSSIFTALQKVATEVGSISDSGLRTRIEEIARDVERLTRDTTDFIEIIDQSKAPTH
jgi:hypothetical protein